MGDIPKIIYLHGTSSSGKSTLARALIALLPNSLHIESDVFEADFQKTIPEGSSEYQYILGLYTESEKRVTNAAPGKERTQALEELFFILENHPLPSNADSESAMFTHILDRYEQGHTVIADDVIPVDRIFREFLTTFNSSEAYFIKVSCPLAVLIERERTRGDRLEGLAEFAEARIHARKIYDLEVDSSTSTPTVMAHHIIEFITTHRPKAIHELFLRLT